MTTQNEKIEKTLVAIEAAFADIKYDITTNGKAATGTIMKAHNLPTSIAGAMYRLNIIRKHSDAGGAIGSQYDFITNVMARAIYDEYLRDQRDKTKTPFIKKKLSDNGSLTFDIPKSEVKPKKYTPRKVPVASTTTTFEIRIFGISLYKVIRQ